jgi:ComF family protein
LSNHRAISFDSDGVPGTAPGGVAGRVAATLGRLARLALPQRCELCAADSGGHLVCRACASALPRVAAACPTCALPSPDGAVCGACLARPPPWSRAIAALVYAYPTDRLLQRLKYAGRLELADWAGEALAAAAATSLATRATAARPDRVVALPLAAPRQRDRGFNQAREIAVRVARRVGLRPAAPLVRTAAAVPQAALAWKERARNVRGAFAVNGDVRGARIALVDDVMTTGATLSEASRTLLRAGAADVECWVVARTLRKGG